MGKSRSSSSGTKSALDSMSSASSNSHVCPHLDAAGFRTGTEPIFGHTTFHRFSTFLGGICGVIVLIITTYLIFRHATHYSVPAEQKQIIRIIFMIAFFAIFSWLTIFFNGPTKYIAPLLDLNEAFTFASFFLLLTSFISPSPSTQDYYASKQPQEKSKAHTDHILHSRKYKGVYLSVFQFPFVTIIMTIITEITQANGTYCFSSSKPYFAHLWVSIIKAVSTFIAVTATLILYRSYKGDIGHHKPVLKFFSFKTIITLLFIQQLIFSFLTSHNHVQPSAKTTLKDLQFGLPALILEIEMIFYAFLYLYAYRITPYRLPAHSSSLAAQEMGGLPDSAGSGAFVGITYQGGFLGWKAIVDAMFMWDLIKGMVMAPLVLLGSKRV